MVASKLKRLAPLLLSNQTTTLDNRPAIRGNLLDWPIVAETCQFAAVHYFAMLDGKSNGGTRP